MYLRSMKKRIQGIRQGNNRYTCDRWGSHISNQEGAQGIMGKKRDSANGKGKKGVCWERGE